VPPERQSDVPATGSTASHRERPPVPVGSDAGAVESAWGAIIIGAGPAGLAAAACLKQAGIETVLLERALSVGASWRRHYDRLHLHTDRAHSGLPGLPMPRSYPRYPARTEVVEYLEAYAGHFRLAPRFGTTATRAVRENGNWQVDTSTGTYRAPVLVVATGVAGAPFRPDWPGVESFGGDIRHSVEYRNPAAYAGKRVLVVGFGNSGGEIALDLADAATSVAVAVRGPVNIIPRELFGIPILNWAIALSRLPPRLADFLAAPLVRLSLGSLPRLGIKRPARGPLADVRERGRVPLIDIGSVAALRRGTIALRPDMRRLHPGEVEFADGRREPYDAIIAATGFHPDLRALLPEASEALDARGVPKISGAPTAVRGLYFCGFHIAPTGQLREIGREARRIARHVVG
jgi:cation diffusion facilitator CzcD-associated flavoprotein CzcO